MSDFTPYDAEEKRMERIENRIMAWMAIGLVFAIIGIVTSIKWIIRLAAPMIWIVMIVGCRVEESMIIQECTHQTYRHDDHVDLIIHSSLDHVLTTRSAHGKPDQVLWIEKEYYDCVSLSLFEIETILRIEAEGICDYVF